MQGDPSHCRASSLTPSKFMPWRSGNTIRLIKIVMQKDSRGGVNSRRRHDESGNPSDQAEGVSLRLLEGTLQVYSRSSVDRVARRAGLTRLCLGEGRNGMVRYIRKEVEVAAIACNRVLPASAPICWSICGRTTNRTRGAGSRRCSTLAAGLTPPGNRTPRCAVAQLKRRVRISR